MPRQRYKFEDAPINMLHPHRATACSCAKATVKSVTVTPSPEDDYATLAQEARRRPISIAMINKLHRAFWKEKP